MHGDTDTFMGNMQKRRPLLLESLVCMDKTYTTDTSLVQTKLLLIFCYVCGGKTAGMYSTDCYHHPPQHHNTITSDPADTHFSYLNTILGCWTLTFSSECSTNTVTSTQKTMRFLSIECYCSYCAESARYFQLHPFFYLLYISHFNLMYNFAHVSV